MTDRIDLAARLALEMLIALKITALALFVITLLSVPARAETVCNGENILRQMEKTDPVALARITGKAAAIPFGKGLLWKVEKPGSAPSHIFGTMHLSDPRIVKLKENAAAALENANTLALEVTDVLDPAAMQQKMSGFIKYTMYLDGTSLPSRASAQDLALIKNSLDGKGGMPWAIASRMKPWVLMALISVPACELERKQEGARVLDATLGERASASGKAIVGLETLESQMQAMDSLPDDMMISALADAARLGGRIEDIFETMIQLYLDGEVAQIWTMMREISPEGLGFSADGGEKQNGYALFQEIIVDKRNRKMVENALPLLEEGKAFIAIGALHLPGEQGLLKLLETQGYKVTRAE